MGLGEREVIGKDWEEWKEGTCGQDEMYERRIKEKVVKMKFVAGMQFKTITVSFYTHTLGKIFFIFLIISFN